MQGSDIWAAYKKFHIGMVIAQEKSSLETPSVLRVVQKE